jgi:photosystem II stability/assembly factor-like uncharacterized protein
MLPSIARAAVATLLAAAPLAARAQPWVPAGPPGGDVRSLAADPRNPRVLYLGTADGVLYRSEDAGESWRRLSPGFPLRGYSLDDLVVDGQGRLFIGYWQVRGAGGGVARSVDGGRTVAVSPGLQGHAVRALAGAPSNPDVLVAGTLGGVFRSQDAGESWSRISPEDHPELRNVNSVTVDPVDPEILYAGTWHLAWKTSDGGRTWGPVHKGMIADSDVMTLTIDPRRPTVVYATACSGIYRSLDGAARWTKVKGIPASSRRTRAFAQDPARPQALYAGTTEGVWASSDGGGSWSRLTSKDLVVNALVVLPGGRILLGCDGAGVLRSDDLGRTWAASNAGFSERFVSRVVFDAAGRMLVGVLGDRRHGGVLAAAPEPGSWATLAPGLEGREVLSLAVSGETIVAGTDDGAFLHAADGWRRLATVLGGIDVHPRVNDLVAMSNRVFLAATPRGLLRTTDGGESWHRADLGLAGAVSALACTAVQPRVLMAATPLGLFRSADAGASWTQVSLPLPEPRVHSLAFLPGNDDVLFAATPTGLFKSADQGRSWARRGGGLPFSDITGLALHPDGRTLFASDFSRGGIYRSADAGDSWTAFTTDGLVSDRVWAMAVDPRAPARLIAATPTGGLHLLSLAPAAKQAGGSQ